MIYVKYFDIDLSFNPIFDLSFNSIHSDISGYIRFDNFLLLFDFILSVI